MPTAKVFVPKIPEVSPASGCEREKDVSADGGDDPLPENVTSHLPEQLQETTVPGTADQQTGQETELETACLVDESTGEPQRPGTDDDGGDTTAAFTLDGEGEKAPAASETVADALGSCGVHLEDAAAEFTDQAAADAGGGPSGTHEDVTTAVEVAEQPSAGISAPVERQDWSLGAAEAGVLAAESDALSRAASALVNSVLAEAQAEEEQACLEREAAEQEVRPVATEAEPPSAVVDASVEWLGADIEAAGEAAIEAEPPSAVVDAGAEWLEAALEETQADLDKSLAATAAAQSAADAAAARAAAERASAAEREAELKRAAEAEKAELVEKLARMTATAESAIAMVGRAQEQNTAQQRRVARLERRVAEAADRAQDLANAVGQERRQLERQVASLAARNTSLEAKLSAARAPPGSRQKGGKVSELLRKVKAIAQEGRETTADIVRIGARLEGIADAFRMKPVSAGAAPPGGPGEAAALGAHARPLAPEELKVMASVEAGGAGAGDGAPAASSARKPRVSAFEEEWPEGMPWADAAAGVAMVALPGAAAVLEEVKGGRGCPAAVGALRGSLRDGDGTWGVSSLMAQSVTSPLAER